MDPEVWSAVDAFIDATVVGADPALDRALRTSAEAGLPAIAVTPAQGKLLALIARVRGARRILEIGTLGGYSTIWLARTLPADGRLISLEANARFAEVARANVEAAGLGDRVEIRTGPALDSLPALAAEATGPFDLVFIDADKPATPAYFTAALGLCRAGSVIVADNVVRGGALGDPQTGDPGGRGMRRLHELVGAEPRVQATTIQTVGSKGYDGFTLALVLDAPNDPGPAASGRRS